MTKQFAASLLMTASLINADTLILRSGNRVEGHYIGGSDRVIRFAVGNQVNTYNVSDVDSVRFYGQQSYSDGQGSGYPQSGSYPPGDSYPRGAYPQASAPPPGSSYPQPSDGGPNAPPPGNYPNNNYPQNTTNYPQSNRYPNSTVQTAPSTPSTPPVGYGGAGNTQTAGEIPAGTQIVVRLIDPVDSERDNLGQTYRASVDEPVVVNGQTMIPRGSDAVATLIDAQKSGKIEGKTVLTLDLKTLTVNNRPYNIVTTGVSQASDSRGARSAKVIGGTAALGAIIGAIAGGGKGAAIGAGSGAAVGTAAEVATSGQKVKVPAETRLTFTLQNPVAF